MKCHNFARQGEAQAGAAFLGREKGLKNPITIFYGDAISLVGDQHRPASRLRGHICRLLQGDCDMSIPLCGFGGILYQVDEDLFQQDFVAMDRNGSTG